MRTLAGSGKYGYADGDGEAAQFSYPVGIAVADNGDIYIADQGNNRIRTCSPQGSIAVVLRVTGTVL